VTSLERGQELHPGEVLEWTLSEADAADPELMVGILVVDIAGTSVLANVQTPPGATSALVPLPPSDVDPAELFGSTAYAYIRTCDSDEADQWCLRGATSTIFMLEP